MLLEPDQLPKPAEPSPARAGLPRVVLASRSPRRRLLLESCGLDFETVDPGLDDAQLEPGAVEPGAWAAALAYLKARAALDRLGADLDGRVVLGADTICVGAGPHGPDLIGQPRDEADAGRILGRLSGGEHDVLTGVALVGAEREDCDLFVARARVRLGPLSASQVEDYIASGLWRGKAGGYNLEERIAAGWPIEFEGDPGTITGLPLRPLLSRLGARAARDREATAERLPGSGRRA